LNRIDEAIRVYGARTKKANKDSLDIQQLSIEIAIAIANNNTALALKKIQKIPESFSAIKAEYYLDLKMWDKAAELIEMAYLNRNGGLVSFSRIKLPEDYPDHPALRKAFDKPELNALFEIRRKNLKDNELNN
jgi:hypothetical protein